MKVAAAVAVFLMACTADPGTSSEPTAPGSPSSASPTQEPVRPWEEATPPSFGEAETWTNKLDLADVDGDGDVDILFADGGDYDVPGEAVRSRVFANEGSGGFTDVSQEVLGDAEGIARVIKARDVNDDGLVDIIVGTTFETQSRLYLGMGGLEFEDVTETHLPKIDASVGDLEVGDVDADGDLDMALADWGPGNPLASKGAPPMLWLNDGDGRFTDASGTHVPPDRIRFSWELEFVDVDGDWDLDLAVSCKVCKQSVVYLNDGRGRFEVLKGAIPPADNNYDFEPMDIDGDGDQDLLTTNDGLDIELGERVLINDGSGMFTDETADRMPNQGDYGFDDNNITFLDLDSDGDADALVSSLDGSDRLLVNDGSGVFTLMVPIHDGARTSGTLWMGVADLDGDTRLDLVEAQGEGAWPEHLYVGAGVAEDTSPPVIVAEVQRGSIVARIVDGKSPSVASDWQEVIVDGPFGQTDMRWFGEYLWSAPVISPGSYEVCATDAAGNETCSDPLVFEGL